MVKSRISKNSCQLVLYSHIKYSHFLQKQFVTSNFKLLNRLQCQSNVMMNLIHGITIDLLKAVSFLYVCMKLTNDYQVLKLILLVVSQT